MMKSYDEQPQVSWYVFRGWMSKHQTTGWKHIGLEALERGTHNPLNSHGLWTSDDTIRTLFIHYVKRLHAVFKGHYSDPKAHDESFWNLWWPRAARLKTLKNWQKSTKTHISMPPPHLHSVHNKNGDKAIMTWMPLTQLSHHSVMCENEIDLKILHWPELEQKGLLCWLY